MPLASSDSVAPYSTPLRLTSTIRSHSSTLGSETGDSGITPALLTVNDAGGLIGAMLGGQGIGQPLEFSVRDLIGSGRLVRLLPDWSDERFPVHAYHRSRGMPSARVRAFLDFVFEIAV